MAAKFKFRAQKNGQSLVEFAFLLPLLIGLLQILIEVSGAISTGIVNQKYASSTLRYFYFNHRHYPEVKFIMNRNGSMMRRYWIGVDDKVNEDLDNIIPRAPVRKVGTLPSQQDGQPQIEFPEVNARQKVRIRATSFTCIPPVSVNPGQLLSEEGLEDSTFVGGRYRYCED